MKIDQSSLAIVSRPDRWIAVPDSLLSDEQTKRDKSVKIGQISRACSIFRVSRIYIYPDSRTNFEKEDLNLTKTLLRYLDTPQYLRKILYPRMNQLEYAGILHPIKAPHHKEKQDIRQIKQGEVRVGVIVKVKNALFVEVGLGSLIKFTGSGYEGKKVNVKFISTYPNLVAAEVNADEIPLYWGYQVKEVPSLDKLFKGITDTEILITSRKGEPYGAREKIFIAKAKQKRNLLIVFGAPKRGVLEILADEKISSRSFEYVINMFPNQGTETVRLEEAVLGTLAIINDSFTQVDCNKK